MPKKSRYIRGIIASSGVVQGKAILLEKAELSISHYWISNKELPGELSRFKSAVEKTKDQLRRIRERLCRYEGVDHIRILDSYNLILKDEMLIKETLANIKSEQINAEWALQNTLQKIKQVFLNIDKEYFRERNSDVDYLGEKILKNLMGKSDEFLQDIPPHAIIVAHNLSPADTAQLMKFKVAGFVTEVGGRTSHTAIIARALQLPAVVGCSKVTQKIKNGDKVVVDGNKGLVLICPTAAELKSYELIKRQEVQFEKMLLKDIHLPTETPDQFRISLYANMELKEEIQLIKEHGAEGVGLYRTEFLFLNRDTIPDEEEHFKNYSQVLKAIYPHSTTIRTLDLGADKVPTHYRYEHETNPALGVRAVRLCLREKDLFKAQLRALMRASVYGKLKILFPLISSLEELRNCKQLLNEVKAELKRKKIQYDPHVKIGTMIEVPSAVMIAEDLAREVDFLSIGTNDLIQYTLAVDRMNEHVAYLYKPLHPAILKMIKRVVDAAQHHKIEVSVCGEMASEPLYILMLLGFGLNGLSMNAVSIPRVKRIIRSVSFKEAKDILDKALQLSTESEIETLLKREVKHLLPEKNQ